MPSFFYIPGNSFDKSKAQSPKGAANKRPVPAIENDTSSFVPLSNDTIFDFLSENICMDDFQKINFCTKRYDNSFIIDNLELKDTINNVFCKNLFLNWKHDNNIDPEKTTEYLLSLAETAYPRDIKDIFSTRRIMHPMHMVELTAAARFAKIMDGFRRVQRGDENMNLLLGKGELPYLVVDFFIKEIFLPTRHFFHETIGNPEQAIFSYLNILRPLFTHFSFEIKKIGNELCEKYFLKNVNENVYKEYISALYMQKNPFIERIQKMRSNLFSDITENIEYVMQCSKENFGIFLMPDKKLDNDMQQFYLSEFFFYMRNVNMLYQYHTNWSLFDDKKDFIDICQKNALSIRNFLLSEQNNEKLFSDQTVITNIQKIILRLSGNKKYFDGDSAAILRHARLKQKTPFIMEPPHEGIMREYFAICLLAEKSTHPRQCLEQAVAMTQEIITANEELQHLRSCRTKEEDGDMLAGKAWRFVLKKCTENLAMCSMPKKDFLHDMTVGRGDVPREILRPITHILKTGNMMGENDTTRRFKP